MQPSAAFEKIMPIISNFLNKIRVEYQNNLNLRKNVRYKMSVEENLKPRQRRIYKSINLLDKFIDTELEKGSLNKTTAKALKKKVNSIRLASVKRPKIERKDVRSGLRQDVEISDKLAEFCGWELGSKHSRTDVTKVICSYINLHELKNPNAKNIVLPDEKLMNILDNPDKEPLGDDGISFPKIQQYIKHHYPKKVVVPVQPPAPAKATAKPKPKARKVTKKSEV